MPKIKVEAAPDLNNMSRIGGVRLTVPADMGPLFNGLTIDLSTQDARELADDIQTELARVRVVMV